MGCFGLFRDQNGCCRVLGVVGRRWTNQRWAGSRAENGEQQVAWWSSPLQQDVWTVVALWVGEGRDHLLSGELSQASGRMDGSTSRLRFPHPGDHDTVGLVPMVTPTCALTQVLGPARSCADFRLAPNVRPELFRTVVEERLRIPCRLRSRAIASEKELGLICREPSALQREASWENHSLCERGKGHRGVSTGFCRCTMAPCWQWTSHSAVRLRHVAGIAPTAAAHGVSWSERAATQRRSTQNSCKETDATSWSREAVHFVEGLFQARARQTSQLLRRSAFLAWQCRWSRMLAVSCGRAFATSLVRCQMLLGGIDGLGRPLSLRNCCLDHIPVGCRRPSPPSPPPKRCWKSCVLRV